MLTDRTILCFASGYDAPPTSKHHVMHLLAERNVVLWVNYHASRAPSATASDVAYIAKKLRQVFAGLKTPRPNLHVLTPLVVPLPASKWARRLNRMLLIRQIRRALKKVAAGPTQLWSFTPDIPFLLGKFGEEKTVYYCVDDHASFTGYNRAQVLADEEELCRRSDLVITTSMALQKAKEPLNPNTLLVPHGVDFDHFAKATANDLPAPVDMADIPRPRLGFFGLIRDWVDLDLMADVARRRPDLHFVLIGDSTVDLSPYQSLSNMHFLGRKPYDALPAYCRQFDVGLIPFKINELTLAVNPIKLREYLAAGLPVVSTPLPEVELYSRHVRIAGDAASFAEQIDNCLNQDSTAQARDARIDAMSKETWPAKVEEICSRLEPEAEEDNGDASRSDALPDGKPKRKVLVIMGGGGFFRQGLGLLNACPHDVDLVVLGPPGVRRKLREALPGRSFEFYTPKVARRLRRDRGLMASVPDLLFGSIAAWGVLRREKPDAVIGVGVRTSMWYLLVAKSLKIRAVYIDSVTRVTRPSMAARLISRWKLADQVYVQWPQAVEALPGSRYRGRLV